MPVYGRKLKNTAGVERNIGLFTQYQRKGYKADYSISNVYQKTGFFPGAHGVPDASRVEDDGDSRNIELPYSKVNHLKVTTHQQYAWEKLILSGDLGFQNNHREEWSAFHTHYGSQPEYIQCFGKSPLYWLFFMGAYVGVGWATSAERHFRLFILVAGVPSFYYRIALAYDV